MIHKLKQKLKNMLQIFLSIDKLEDDFKKYKINNNDRVSSIETKSLYHGQILNKQDNKIATLHDTLSEEAVI